jgi:hypothetical protein
VMRTFFRQNPDCLLLMAILCVVLYVGALTKPALFPVLCVFPAIMFGVLLLMLWVRLRLSLRREFAAQRRARIEPHRARVRQHVETALRDICSDTASLSDAERALLVREELTDTARRNWYYCVPPY